MAGATNQANSDHDQIIGNIAALGWALTELLFRCYLLQPLAPYELNARAQEWLGKDLLILRPIRTDRQKINAVYFYIKSLAQQLELDGKIEDDETIGKLEQNLGLGPDKIKDQSYLDLLWENVDGLCNASDPAAHPEFRGRTNGLLQFWDTVIYEQLQDPPTSGALSTDPEKTAAYLNAYLVGRSLSTLACDLDLDQVPLYGPAGSTQDQKVKSVRDQILTKESLPQLRQNVLLMDASLQKFAAPAIANSVEQWGNALLQAHIGGNVDAKAQDRHAKLQEQAVVWHDLLTSSRDPISYVEPTRIGWRYALKVFLFLLPYIAVGIVLIGLIVVFFLFLLGYLWPLIVNAVTKNPTLVSIIATIGSGFALLTGIGVAIPPIGALWNWLTGKVQSNVSQNADNGIGGALTSLTSMLWDTAQQEEVNSATYVRVP